MSEKIYRVQMNSKGMPNFSTAEPIVRCKECKYRPDSEWLHCSYVTHMTNADDFCSYGCREERSE